VQNKAIRTGGFHHLTVLAAALIIPSVAGANPALEAKVRELEAKLRAAEQELAKLRAPATYFVDCERTDLERTPRRLDPSESEDLGRVIERLSTRPADPVYDRAQVGTPDLKPNAYMVRPGCSFLGGDRITEVNGVPVSDTKRLAATLRYQDRWRFTIGLRQHLGTKVEDLSAQKAFDLAGALGVSGTEAQIVPFFSEGKERGFLVWSVTPGGYLASAGLEPKDVLVSVNRLPLSHAQAEKVIATEWKAKGRLAIEVLRDGRSFFLRTIAAGSGGR
jgi:S1-C subfamily serine protease